MERDKLDVMIEEFISMLKEHLKPHVSDIGRTSLEKKLKEWNQYDHVIAHLANEFDANKEDNVCLKKIDVDNFENENNKLINALTKLGDKIKNKTH